MRPLASLLVILLFGAPAAAHSAQSNAAPSSRPQTFEALVGCRSIADDADRLRCFDAAAAELQAAAERREVVVVDRQQVRETRRRLFGLPLPRLPIFGGGGGDDEEEEEEVSSIESVVASARQDANGRWIIRLEDGSTWAQTDNNPVAMAPRRGHPVRVQRGAFGSFMMRINNQPGVRARRQL